MDEVANSVARRRAFMNKTTTQVWSEVGRIRSRTHQVVGVTLLALAAACTVQVPDETPDVEPAEKTGTDAEETDAGEGGATAVSNEDVDPCSERVPETIDVDQAFWHSGFNVTIKEALLVRPTAACSLGMLELNAEFYNRGGETYRFDARTLVTSAGRDYPGSLADSDVPNVPGQRTGTGTLAFVINRDFVLDRASLVVGGADEHQAVVPLGDQSPDDLVSLEPQEFEVKEKFDAGGMSFTVDSMLVRADSPSQHGTLDPDVLEISFYFSATLERSFQRGSVLSRDSFLLDLPNGTSVAPVYAPVELLDHWGSTIADLVVLFHVPRPEEGEYALVVGGRWNSGNQDWAEGQLAFDLPQQAVFGARE
jgi:hypothetical protein